MSAGDGRGRRSASVACMVGLLVLSGGCGGSSNAAPTSGTTTSGITASSSPASEPSPDAATARACAAVMSHLPATVANQARGRVTRLTAQWGNPAITLRCGVAKPAALTPDAQCDGVNGVGWLTEQAGDGYRFTTIGRAGYVEVSVPGSIQPPSDALVDLSDAVHRLRLLKPCV